MSFASTSFWPQLAKDLGGRWSWGSYLDSFTTDVAKQPGGNRARSCYEQCFPIGKSRGIVKLLKFFVRPDGE